MDERIDNQTNHEIIVLSDLKDINKNLIDEYFDQKSIKCYYRWRHSDEEKPRIEEEKKKILKKKFGILL